MVSEQEDADRKLHSVYYARLSRQEKRKKADLEHKPTAIYYTRVSHQDQVDSGLRIEDDRRRFQDHYHYHFAKKGIEWGGIITDKEVSGGKPLFKRPGGRILQKRLQRGDHVVVSSLDRAFRVLLDCANCVELWGRIGVTFHIVEGNIDSSNEMGLLIIKILGIFAEFERRRIIERTKRACRIRKDKGMPIGKRSPKIGYRWEGPKGKMRQVPCEYTLAIMEKMLELRHRGYSWNDIMVFSWEKRWKTRLGGTITWSCAQRWCHEAQLIMQRARLAGWQEHKSKGYLLEAAKEAMKWRPTPTSECPSQSPAPAADSGCDSGLVTQPKITRVSAADESQDSPAVAEKTS